MIEPAAEAARSWAADLTARHGTPVLLSHLRHIYEQELTAPGLRGAMAKLEHALFVAAFVHYRSNGDVRAKVKEVMTLADTTLSRRAYYDLIDRVHYYVAGYLAAQSHARP